MNPCYRLQNILSLYRQKSDSKGAVILFFQTNRMTERELMKLEGTIRRKMDDIRNQRMSLKDSGLGGLMNSLKKVDEALYEKILVDYKKMVSDHNIFK